MGTASRPDSDSIYGYKECDAGEGSWLSELCDSLLQQVAVALVSVSPRLARHRRTVVVLTSIDERTLPVIDTKCRNGRRKEAALGLVGVE